MTSQNGHLLWLWEDRVLFGYRKKLLGESDWKIYDPNKIDGKGLHSEYIDLSQELKDISLTAKKAIGKDINWFRFYFYARWI